MSKSKWVSLKIIHDRILRDSIFTGLNTETIVDYFIDFITIVGSPELFDESISVNLPIENYRATLPDNFVEEVQVSINKYMSRQSTDTHAGYYQELNDVQINTVQPAPIDTSYKIKGGYIYSSIQTGELILVYKSIKVQDDDTADDYGYPMVIDDPVFMLAFQAYVEKNFLAMLFRSNKVSQQVLDRAERDYAWAVGRYETHSKRLTLGAMESISKMFRNIHHRTNEFSSRFKNLGVV